VFILTFAVIGLSVFFYLSFKLKKRELKFLVYWVIIPLLIGTLIYLLFRPLSIRLFNVFNENQLNLIIQLRTNLGVSSSDFPVWFTNSLPDGLWLFSFTNILSLIWINRNGMVKNIFLLVPILIGLIHELIQFFNVNYGTFDIIDVFTYLIFYLFSCVLIKIIKLET
jgi:hypothetical protein